MAGQRTVEILCQDILTVDLTQLAAERGVRLQVVGNLPYYISSPILMHLFAHSAVIDRAVLMAQREVAERIAAAPGTRAYGLLSATTQMYATVENLFTLPPEAFAPPPEVYSTVIRLTMHSRFEELGVEPAGFLRFLRQIFALKRKTLANNLRASGYDPAAVDGAFTQCAWTPNSGRGRVAGGYGVFVPRPHGLDPSRESIRSWVPRPERSSMLPTPPALPSLEWLVGLLNFSQISSKPIVASGEIYIGNEGWVPHICPVLADVGFHSRR